MKEHTRIKADFRLLTSEEGGRLSPISSGYHAAMWFGETNAEGLRMYWDGFLTVEKDRVLCPGDSAVVFIEPLVPETLTKARPGVKFEVAEGWRVIGEARVRELVEP